MNLLVRVKSFERENYDTTCVSIKYYVLTVRYLCTHTHTHKYISNKSGTYWCSVLMRIDLDFADLSEKIESNGMPVADTVKTTTTTTKKVRHLCFALDS